MAQLIYTIPDNKIAEFQEAFLIARPAPDGMSTNAWIKQWGKAQFKNVYIQGRRMLAERTAIIDKDIIG